MYNIMKVELLCLDKAFKPSLISSCGDSNQLQPYVGNNLTTRVATVHDAIKETIWAYLDKHPWVAHTLYQYHPGGMVR
jgi:hypothetical protein